MAVNGEIASFVLDLAGHTAILSEYLETLKIDPSSPGPFKYSKISLQKCTGNSTQ